MARKETLVYLHDNEGLRVDVCQYEDLAPLMETNPLIAYGVFVEGVKLDNDHFQEYRTISIYTREDHEEKKELGLLKFDFASK